MSLAGRMTYSWNKLLPGHLYMRVGYYDDKQMPAVMLFDTADCKGESSFHMYDRRSKAPGAFSIDDISDQRSSNKIKSVMLRKGY